MFRRLLPILACAACDTVWIDEPANLGGDYTFVTVDAENGCEVERWVEGRRSAPFPVHVEQDGRVVTALVGDGTAVGAYLDLVFGSHTYRGRVTGGDVALELVGVTSFSRGACTYTLTSRGEGTLDGDALTGEFRLLAITNRSPECGALTDCASRQTFIGLRAP